MNLSSRTANCRVIVENINWQMEHTKKITSASRELMFLIMVVPKMPDIAPDKQAPTTTHTSNIVTNFDVADRMLMNDDDDNEWHPKEMRRTI